MEQEMPSGIDAIVARLMADPSIMAAVSEAAAELGGSKRSADGREGVTVPAADTAAAPSQLATLLGGISGGSQKAGAGDEERRHRRDLLNALKPYLGSHRRETIDHMLGIERLGDALKMAQKH